MFLESYSHVLHHVNLVATLYSLNDRNVLTMRHRTRSRETQQMSVIGSRNVLVDMLTVAW